MADPLLWADDLCVQRLDPIDGRRHLIFRQSVRLDPGQVLIVRGPSGGGKSIFAQALGGFVEPSDQVSAQSMGFNLPERERYSPLTVSGQSMSGDGVAYRRWWTRHRLGRRVGLIPQNARSALLPGRTIGWHLQYEFQRLDSMFDDREVAKRVFNSVADQLSTGQCQRALMAITMKPGLEVLIADEPFASLDPAATEKIQQAWTDFLEQGGGIIWVTHRPERPARWKDVQPICIGDQSLTTADTPSNDAETAFANRLKTNKRHQADQLPRRGILELRNVSVRLGDEVVFENQSLQIWSGERVGILGRSGGGKTTLLRLILGWVTADAGSVDRFNQPHLSGRLTMRQRRELWRRIGWVAQDPDAIFDADVPPGLSLLAKLPGDRPAAWRAACTAIKAVGLSPGLLSAPAGRLSGGERRRLVIAMTLLQLQYTPKIAPEDQEKLLLLDEPTVGVDSFHQHCLEESLNGVSHQQPYLSFVLCSHDQKFLESTCDRIIHWPIAQKA